VPKDVSILVVEHDMDLGFRFAFLGVDWMDEAEPAGAAML